MGVVVSLYLTDVDRWISTHCECDCPRIGLNFIICIPNTNENENFGFPEADGNTGLYFVGACENWGLWPLGANGIASSPEENQSECWPLELACWPGLMELSFCFPEANGNWSLLLLGTHGNWGPLPPGPMALRACTFGRRRSGSLVLHMPFAALCPLHVPQVPGSGARVWRWAVRLPGKEGETDPQGGPEILPPDRVSAGLLPQLLHLVRGSLGVRLGQALPNRQALKPECYSPLFQNWDISHTS